MAQPVRMILQNFIFRNSRILYCKDPKKCKYSAYSRIIEIVPHQQGWLRWQQNNWHRESWQLFFFLPNPGGCKIQPVFPAWVEHLKKVIRRYLIWSKRKNNHGKMGNDAVGFKNYPQKMKSTAKIISSCTLLFLLNNTTIGPGTPIFPLISKRERLQYYLWCKSSG